MHRLQGLAAQCSDWGRLVSEKPTGEDARAFGELATLLLPYLQSTRWPDRAEFPGVEHRWPNVPTLQYQYVGLM
eukprot:5277248-Lingulodinium_polyedra.AAC.1